MEIRKQETLRGLLKRNIRINLIDDILKNPKKVTQLSKKKIICLLNSSSKMIEKNKLIKIKLKKGLVVGDLHGDFNSLLHCYRLFLKNKYDKMIFLGDYVDRGPKQKEVINFLLLLKLKYKHKMILLRGNHETKEINQDYGFYNVLNDDKLYQKYNQFFELLPLVAIINNNIMCVHGGISSIIRDIHILNNKIKLKNNFIEELIWNDPDWSERISGFKRNWRGSYTFGKDVFYKFMRKNRLDLLIRSHEITDKIAEKGYNYCFNKKLLSIYSSSNYGYEKIKKCVCEIKNDEIFIINDFC